MVLILYKSSLGYSGGKNDKNASQTAWCAPPVHAHHLDTTRNAACTWHVLHHTKV